MGITVTTPGLTGTGSTQQIACWYATDSSLIGYSAFGFDTNNNRLTLGGGRFTAGTSFPSTPSASDIHDHTTFRCRFFYDGSAWQQAGEPTFASSFPTSPPTGLRVRRADRMKAYTYDGTRWLSDPFLLPFVPYYVASAQQPFSATSQVYVTGLPPATDLWVDGFQCGHYFSAANSGTNYWTVALGADTTSGTSTIGSYTTSAATSTGYYLPSAITSFSTNPLPRSTYFSLSINITKSGSAPAIEMYPSVRVREVG